MLICGHCGGLVKSLSDLAVHLRCEEKPQALVVVENTSTNKQRDAILLLNGICLRFELLGEKHGYLPDQYFEYANAKEFVVQNSTLL